MTNGSSPVSVEDLGRWVVDTLLDPASAMFREGNVVLSEEDRVVDTTAYFAVLAAISQGKTRRGEIAASIGRSEGALAHPLTVLAAAQLVDAIGDALKQKRTTFHIAEPVLRLHQLVIAPNEARLNRHQGERVWAEVADTVSSQIYGPHFEHVCRLWCSDHAAASTLGGPASSVGPTTIACRQHRVNHHIDVVVVTKVANVADRIVAIGEAKWRNAECDISHLRRLEHVRQLLAVSGPVKLLLFSRAGFSRELTADAVQRADVELVGTARVYRGV